MTQTSFPRHRIRITLLENVHPAAAAALEACGYSVEVIPHALEGSALHDVMVASHVIGVRSRTKLRGEHIALAGRMLAIGCFSVGTDHVDIGAAELRGIPVFNAPHASTRSVAELTLGCVIALARRLGDKSAALHRGHWDKSLAGAHEIRGHTIGIVGYGHIGQQVGLLAEAFGMRVLFYDIVKRLALGLARPVADLDALLEEADAVTLHVPETPRTVGMIGKAQLARMHQGSYLLNLSRGKVVDAEALRDAVATGHLGGTALDVYNTEPTPQVAEFDVGFCNLPNVILMPHVGGNTQEAQKNIGLEVAHALTEFIDRGSTDDAVNFPQLSLPPLPGTHRILNIHQNVPGVLAAVNNIVSEVGANIDAQRLATTRDIGYLVMDLNREVSDEVHTRISALPMNVRTRILY
jgi:D-3-phosphoglycerate dehydrogenase / 2-oxoglutarate reductase